MSRTSYEIEASMRDRVGKGAARALRRDGLIPAVIYGDKKPPIPIAISRKDMTRRLHAGGFLTTTATIAVGGETHTVLPKAYELDPVRDFLMHVDFLRIGKGSVITVALPVHVTGEEKSVGLKRGGVLNYVRHEIDCNVPGDAIPDAIVCDVSSLDIGDSLHISAVALPKDVTPVIQDRDFTILTCAAPAGIREELAKEAGEAEGEG